MNGPIGCFSGRFDPPNLGHVLTILELLQTYETLLIPILDYEDRALPADDARRIFWAFAERAKIEKRVQFFVNDVHFGKITWEQYSQVCDPYQPEVVRYLSGNVRCLQHMRTIGARVAHVPRVTIPGIDQEQFSSTSVRRVMANIPLEKYYNISVAS